MKKCRGICYAKYYGSVGGGGWALGIATEGKKKKKKRERKKEKIAFNRHGKRLRAHFFAASMFTEEKKGSQAGKCKIYTP